MGGEHEHEEAEDDSRERLRRLFPTFVVLVAIILTGLLGKNSIDKYVAEDPRFCQSCHEANPGVSIWASDSHARVACQRCHALDEEQLRTMLIAVVAGSKEEPHPKLDPEHIKCESCHLAPDHKKKPVMAAPGHAQHTKSVKVSCLECHGSRVHRIVKPETVCRHCHKEIVARVDRMNELHCQTCHNFIDPDKTILPGRADCQACHDARRVPTPEFPPGGHMTELPCFVCHEPHAAADPGEGCAGCHVDVGKSEAHEKHRKERCQACHKPHGFEIPKAICADHHTGSVAPTLRHAEWSFEDTGLPLDWESIRHTWTASVTNRIRKARPAKSAEPR